MLGASMKDGADSDLRQNTRTILGISVQDNADFDMPISNNGYTAQTRDFPLVFTPKRHCRL